MKISLAKKAKRNDSPKKTYGIKRNLLIVFAVLCACISLSIIYDFFSIEFLWAAEQVTLKAVLSTIILFGCFVLICIVFWKTIYIPVSKIESIIATLLERKLSSDPIEPENSRKKIPQNLDGVISKLQDLVNNEYAAEIMKNQAELNALQSQINPHFLYNTLESIRGQAIVHKVKDIEIMTKALADMFRYIISTKSALISFREELINVDNYLKIQQFRFNNKFIIEKEIGEDTVDNQIPKLLIQPIVENALQHGLEMKRTRGKIAISAYCSDEKLIVNIKDNGLGMDIDQFQKLNEALATNVPLKGKKSGSGGSIGLLNVNERIKMTYGNDYGIKIFSAENVGTNVEIILKSIKKKPTL